MNTIIIDDQNLVELVFDQGGEVHIFDQTQTQTIVRRVTVKNNTKLRWYGLFSGVQKYSLNFFTESGESIVRALLVAGGNEALDITVNSTLRQFQTISNVHILSLVGEKGIIDLNGAINIESNISKIKGHILQENIFLGSRGIIRGIPSLFVHSDDVEAGHAARIERVSDEKLYYLRSRGIPKNDSIVMMIESAVVGLFEGLEDKYLDIVMEKVQRIF